MAIGVIHSVSVNDGSGWIRVGNQDIHFDSSVLQGVELSTDLNEKPCNVAIQGGEAIRVSLRD